MSLENGDGIFDYEELKHCYDEYKKDNKIFEKGMLLLNFYMNQPAWPHSFNLYEEECSNILKGSPYWIGRIGGQLIPHFDNTSNYDIDSNFKNDLAFFSKTTWSLLDDAYYSRVNPLGLSSLSSTQTNDGDIIVKISRSDKMSLELLLNKHDLNRMIESLTNLAKQGD